MPKPLVTIMMPTRNRGHFILDAIQSLLNQSYTNWELIILDDNSEDDTEEIVKLVSDFDNRIRYIKSKSNNILGRIKARNRILELSRGELVGHLDDDDFLRYDAIEKIVTEFVSNTNLALVYSDFIEVDEDKNIIREDVGIDFDKGKLPWLGFRHFTIYKKSIALKFGGFNENVWCEDGDLFMQIAREFECRRVPEFLYFYRSHATNFGRIKPSCKECNKQNVCNFFRIWTEECQRLEIKISD